MEKKACGNLSAQSLFVLIPPAMCTKKWKIYLLIIIAFTISTPLMAQTVTLPGKTMPLEAVLSLIEKQTGYAFLYKEHFLADANPVAVRASNMPLLQLLDAVFKDQPLEYTIKGRTIFLSRKQAGHRLDNADQSQVVPGAYPLKVLVTDSAGKPLAGASVCIKKNRISKITNNDGAVVINAAEGDVMEVTYIGFQPQTAQLGRSSHVVICLKPSEKKLEEVIVNAGILTRKKESFTGAVATFTGKELKQVGNGNVLESLKTLDPSFIIMPNNSFGSNPNRLPDIQLRGTTSVSATTSNTIKNQFSTDPNQPLFILNGMESSLQQIVNLDINRIASITILKDAASTALYGSKAANGVVVVETKRPQPGNLQVSYTTDFRAEMPALGGYNMMNAAELLEFQKLSGYFNPAERQESRLILDTLYNNRLKAVLGGENSYWLNVPLRNAFTTGHVLGINGGSNEFQYDVTLSYRSTPGVMKGSGKNTWGGSVDLTYRKKKLNFTNRTYIEGSKASESPYGSFADYVNIAPYYRKFDDKGRLFTGKYLESFDAGEDARFLTQYQTPNPIYNASLNPENASSYFNVLDNLSLIWNISPNWRFTSGIQLNKSVGSTTVFVPSANTAFDGVDINEKGSYNYEQQSTWGYNGNAMITYQKVFNTKHSLTGNVRAALTENNSTTIGLQAVGFPDGVAPNPAFAYGYAINSKPGYSEVKTRQVSSLASVNYVFANKYFVDATYTIDGSTVFGSAEKYTPFWGVGLGWTVSRENFLKDADWLTLLRLRGNIGTNGNQQLGSFVSSSVYGYSNTSTSFGTGLFLNQLGTPNLAWQRTQQISAGIDLTTWNSRFIATLNAYQKLTNPLIVPASAAASTGVPNYALNVGKLTVKGLELILKYSPILQPDKAIQWTLGVTGSITKSRYSNFASMMARENELARNKFNDEKALKDIPNYLKRYMDGYSPDDIWAVRSLGIDPASGNEILLKKDGTHTFYYNSDDEVAVGSAIPKVQGVISSTLNIKGFSMGIFLRYSIAQSNFNTAIFNKVENIGFAQLIYNQDKRALYDRWRQPGDIAFFKNINLSDPNVTSTYSPPSSRFIQTENFLSGESISAGYEFLAAQHPWINKIRAKTLRISGYLNDIFRISNVTRERGTDYPFAKSFSFSMSLFF